MPPVSKKRLLKRHCQKGNPQIAYSPLNRLGEVGGLVQTNMCEQMTMSFCGRNNSFAAAPKMRTVFQLFHVPLREHPRESIRRRHWVFTSTRPKEKTVGAPGVPSNIHAYTRQNQRKRQCARRMFPPNWRITKTTFGTIC